MSRFRSRGAESQSVNRRMLLDALIGSDQIDNLAVLNRHLWPESVDRTKIGGGAVELRHIGDDVHDLLGKSTIEHVTLHAVTSQTIAAGGGTVQFDTAADEPTERRGFDTLATELESGAVGDIPIDVDGLCQVIFELQFYDASTGVALDKTGVDVTLTVRRTRSGGAADWPDLLIDTDLVGIVGPITGNVKTDDTLTVTIDPSADVIVGGLVYVDVWAVAQPAAPNTCEPLLRWGFNETSGTTAAEDLNGLDGTYVGSPTLGVSGPGSDVGFALATDDYASIPDDALLDVDTISVEVWLKTTAPNGGNGTQGEIAHARASANTVNWSIYEPKNTDRELDWFVQTQGGVTVSTSVPNGSIRDGGWHHIVGTYDGVQAKVYVDGSLVDSSTPLGSRDPIAKGSGDLLVGRDTHPSVGSTGYLDGACASLRIRSCAMQPHEVTASHTLGSF